MNNRYVKERRGKPRHIVAVYQYDGRRYFAKHEDGTLMRFWTRRSGECYANMLRKDGQVRTANVHALPKRLVNPRPKRVIQMDGESAKMGRGAKYHVLPDQLMPMEFARMWADRHGYVDDDEWDLESA